MPRKKEFLTNVVFSSDMTVDMKEDMQGDMTDLVTEQPKIRIQFSYPLENYAFFTFRHKGGFSLLRIICLVQKTYLKIYADPERFGIWGHNLDDLCLTGITIRGDLVTLDVGS